MPNLLFSCSANPTRTGGLNLHFAQLLAEARETGTLAGYFANGVDPQDGAKGRVIRLPLLKPLYDYTPLRFTRAGRDHVGNELFDRAVAAALTPGADGMVAFVGKALRTFRRARALGMGHLEVVAANSHVDNVRERHAAATAQWGMERTWLGTEQAAKTRREYEAATVIQVASPYTRDTFLRRGVAPEKLRWVPLQTHPRFQPPAARPADGVFRITYVGQVSVLKGVPVLLEAFARLPFREAELTLVGGPATRAMRQYLAAWQARDARIRVAPGDPLPALHRADVQVHPTYEDGHAYAPMEALAAGVPVIASEDTGMKCYLAEGVNGYVVPTGDVGALVERLVHVRAHPLAATRSLLPDQPA